MKPTDTKLNIGVVGLGKMGIMHACLLNVFPNVKVAALCDKSRLMRTIAKHAFTGAVVTDSLEQFADLNLDAIFVLTPIPVHYPLIKQIYRDKLAANVFAEKTLTNAYSKSTELTELAKASGGVNMVGYMKRFGVTFNQAKNLLQQQVLGEVQSFEAYAYSSDFAEVPEGSEVSAARGGVLEDLGSHVVDVAGWFFGDLKVSSAVVNSRISPGSEDDVTFEVAGQDGLGGKFDVSWRKENYRMPEFGLTVHGQRGSLSVNDDEVKLELAGESPKRWYRLDLDDNVGFLLGGPEYYREDQHFLDCITSKNPCKSTFESTLRVDLLLDQVRRQISK
ncbi:MAG: Gfo/Idh/MocA family oxidoreductase [Candidatus Bathyarchaeota archaeon]|nr:Gfo/Idh/MocA family oxidoreductase [Candidatus Bathyarchaeota archaeon]